jgi:pseudaminic acid cytidylyltransferase
MNFAIIPARGGSKRILGKNTKLFRAKPIIAYSICAAINSKLFDKVIVSTDSEEIAKVAKEYGAEVPFLRPADISDDQTGIVEVIQHAINTLTATGCSLDLVCCIFATAPLIDVSDLKKGYELLKDKKWGFAFSATEFDSPIERAFTLKEGSVNMIAPQNYNVRSQDLTSAYHDAGQFYWGKSEAWIQEERIFDQNSTIIKIPKWRVQDIDTPDDWERAEFIHKTIEYMSTKNQKQIDYYLGIIDEIEKVRSRNNVNWMDILRLSFRHAPEDTKELMLKVNTEDDKVSALLKKLSNDIEA